MRTNVIFRCQFAHESVTKNWSRKLSKNAWFSAADMPVTQDEELLLQPYALKTLFCKHLLCNQIGLGCFFKRKHWNAKRKIYRSEQQNLSLLQLSLNMQPRDQTILWARVHHRKNINHISWWPHYSKSQIFVQKFKFDKTPTFSRVFHKKSSRCPKLDGYAIANFGVRVELKWWQWSTLGGLVG